MIVAALLSSFAARIVRYAHNSFAQDDFGGAVFPPQLVILSNAKDLYIHT